MVMNAKWGIRYLILKVTGLLNLIGEAFQFEWGCNAKMTSISKLRVYRPHLRCVSLVLKELCEATSASSQTA